MKLLNNEIDFQKLYEISLKIFYPQTRPGREEVVCHPLSLLPKTPRCEFHVTAAVH